VTVDDHKDRKAEHRTQIWIAVISALSGIAIAAIGLIGTLRATDSKIVSGPVEPGPTVTRTVTVAPTATVTETVDTNGGGDEVGSTSPVDAETALDVTWKTDIREWGDDIGHKVLFDCPPRGIPQDIWGDRLYYGNSSVCTAAVHDGRISLPKGGRVTVEVREGSSSYPGTRRNGITSEKRTGFPTSSFEFLPPRNA
jgi:LCCL domain